jgi:hypothetical protein
MNISPHSQNKVIIASIFWSPIRLHNNFLDINLELKAVSRADVEAGKYSYVVIPDLIQKEVDPTATGSSPVYREYFKSCDEVAPALIKDCVHNQMGCSPQAGLMPGVGCFRSQPTKDDLQALLRVQVALAKSLVDRADLHYNSGERGSITDRHFKAAEFLGIKNALWIPREGATGLRKACPFCTETMHVAALRCPNCKEVVDPAGYKAMLERMEEEALDVETNPKLDPPPIPNGKAGKQGSVTT